MNRTNLLLGIGMFCLLAVAAFFTFSCAEYPEIATTTIAPATTTTAGGSTTTTTSGGTTTTSSGGTTSTTGGGTTTTGTPATTTTTTTTTTTLPRLSFNWTRATAEAFNKGIRNFSAVVFITSDGTPEMGVIGGINSDGVFTNEVWATTNGINWIFSGRPKLAYRQLHTSVFYNNNIWVIGGENILSNYSRTNEVSGLSLTGPPSTALGAFSPRASHTSVVFDGKIWVIGGETDTGLTNDAWSSTDGITWTQEDTAPFSPARYGHHSVVQNGKIWVIGGLDYASSPNHQLNDVWSSTDGKVWVRESTLAALGPPPTVSPEARISGAAVTFESGGYNYIALNGGYNSPGGGEQLFNDLRYSANGLNWATAESSSTYPARRSHASLVFDGKIWVIGGQDSLFNTLNDVWYAPIP